MLVVTVNTLAMGAWFIWLKDLPLSSQLLNIYNFIYLQFWQRDGHFFSSCMIRSEGRAGGGRGPKMTVINSGATQKSGLQRFTLCLPEDSERPFFSLLPPPSSLDTDCGESRLLYSVRYT